MAMSREEIYSKVQGVLVDALGVDEDQVKPSARLRQDLGAESIDFLDIPADSFPSPTSIVFTFQWAASGHWEGTNYEVKVV